MKAITTDDASLIRTLAKNPNFIPAKLFVGVENGHKFKAGDKCRLVGLESFPEFNGTEVTIEGVREDGKHGKAYYVTGAIGAYLNWIYEYRLEPITTHI